MEIKYELKVNEQLDPLYETIGLLYGSYHMESFKEDLVSQLEGLGLNGEAFYTKHLTLLEKYFHSFMKHRVDGEGALFFFGDEDGVFYLIMQFLLVGHPNWLNEVQLLTEDTIRESLRQTILHLLQDEVRNVPDGPIQAPEEIVAFLGACSFGEAVKWKLLRVLLQPKQWIAAYVALVNANLAAYEEAYQESGKPINKLIQAYAQSIRQQNNSSFIKMIEGREEVTVIPTLVTPLAVVVNRSQVYYGVLVDSITNASGSIDDVRDYLLMRLKALSDSSKLQLLALLKQSPKYNLELANQLGITAATTSHHMNALLASELVSIEKMNGKVFYHLNKDRLKQFIQQLEHYLLS